MKMPVESSHNHLTSRRQRQNLNLILPIQFQNELDILRSRHDTDLSCLERLEDQYRSTDLQRIVAAFLLRVGLKRHLLTFVRSLLECSIYAMITTWDITTFGRLIEAPIFAPRGLRNSFCQLLDFFRKLFNLGGLSQNRSTIGRNRQEYRI